MEVATPAGTWRIRRRWAPRLLRSQSIWERFRERASKSKERTSWLAEIGSEATMGDGIVGTIIAIVLFLLLLLVILPLVIALSEALIIVLLAALGMSGRILFRRPWTVEAVAPDGETQTWEVVGWRPSSAARSFAAERIAAGAGAPTESEMMAAVLAR